jgi:hypothetical protein
MSPSPAELAAAEKPPFDCRKCGRHVLGQKADDAGWCETCRAELIRRSTRQSYLPAAVIGVAYLWLLWWSGLLETPLAAVWLVLGAVIVFVSYKVARRVFFDLLRGRPTGDRKS